MQNNFIISRYSEADRELKKELREFLNEIDPTYIDQDGVYVFENKKIAVEMKSLYNNCDLFYGQKPHFNKFMDYLSKGIQLVTVWEDQWCNKRDVCKHIITSKFGIYKERIYARKCEVRDVSSKDANAFLNAYHLQGTAQAKYKYGLYYNDRLVAFMSFGCKRKFVGGNKANPTEFELVRFCGLPDVQVIGGASKLLKHFLNEHPETVEIDSYSSNDISVGGLYEGLGFTFINRQYGSYWYIEMDSLKRIHRYNFRKSELVKQGYDPSLTEREIMAQRPYWRIYDCGQSLWKWRKDEPKVQNV